MGFLSIIDIRSQLSMASSSDDIELVNYADAACDIVEQWCGPIQQRTITDEYVDTTYVGPRVIVLAHRPVLSLTSITGAGAGAYWGSAGSFWDGVGAGTIYDPADFVLEGSSGTVRRVDGYGISGPIRVTYVAGYASPPAWAMLAAKIIAQHLWNTRNGPSSRTAVTSATTVPGVGYAIPNQAAALMEPHRVLPAIA